MADYEISETGVYVDLANGAVVTDPPENGRQLVPPGGELTPARVADIDAAKASGPQVVEESVSDPEPDGDDKPKKAAPAKKAAGK